MTYREFLEKKIDVAPLSGLDVGEDELNPVLKPHQRVSVLWALRGGRRALFARFGLGKTVMQLEWCRLVQKHVGGKALIVLPLNVKREFVDDAENLLHMAPPVYVRNMAEADASDASILVTNYERVRDGDIDPKQFTAVSLDEAATLRSFGSKTYQVFLDKFKGVRYKLVNTATPSPNRYKELIHYAAFLEVMDSGQALAQPITAKVLTPSGWKQMGDIKVGDNVISVDGMPTTVTGIYPQGIKNIYRVYFNDGSSTRCTDEHLWTTQTQYERNACKKFLSRNPEKSDSKYWTVKETSEIMNTLREHSTGARNHMIPMVKSVQFEKRSVDVDPYLMGLILGDGSIRKTSINYTTADEWIVKEIRRIVSSLGLDILKNEHIRKDGQPNYDYRISAGVNGRTGRGHKSNVVLNAMYKYGLVEKCAWEKFIPEDYLINTPDVRLSVLQGLMDSDGTICRREKSHTIRYTTTSPLLVDNVKFIVQSLGGTVHIRTYYGRTPSGKQGRLQYRVTLRLPNGIIPFRIPRKADYVKENKKYPPKRYIDRMEYCGKEEAKCIMVEHEKHLYITDDFIVTHNTRFFKRDSTKANNLTFYPGREREFWIWCASWGLFLKKPSDLGFSDEGYSLPLLDIRYHRLDTDLTDAGCDRDGQLKLARDAAFGLRAAAPGWKASGRGCSWRRCESSARCGRPPVEWSHGLLFERNIPYALQRIRNIMSRDQLCTYIPKKQLNRAIYPCSTVHNY